jgi:uncharacterized protein (TIGR02453 family)
LGNYSITQLPDYKGLTMTTHFPGFPTEAMQFLADLADNNNRDWFEAHKKDFKRVLLEPAQVFVLALGEGLQTIAPNIQYDTRTNGSGTLMRIHRDTRFSEDKTPYKTNISGLLWQGAGKKTQCPAFGFQLQSSGMALMAGMFGFDKGLLEKYRTAVNDPTLGTELATIVHTLDKKYELAGQHYKRVPSGFAADHPRADLLRHNALFAHPRQELDIKTATSPQLVEACLTHFAAMAPIQQWLVKVVNA